VRALFLALVFVFVFAGCKKARTSHVYEIPQGFTGWVLIEFGRTNCPPITKRDAKLIFQIGKDGRFCTSSAPEFGWAKDAYFYVGKSRTEIPSTVSGRGGLIWGGGTGSVQVGSLERTYETFYVGTEEQFKQAAKQPIPE
jgi:hypothetical protein